MTPHQHTKDLTDYIAAYSPLVAVVVALLIGWTQKRLQQRQFAQDLFDKRIAVYRIAGTFLNRLIYRNWLDPNDFSGLDSALLDAHFLFRSDVRSLITEIRRKAEHYVEYVDGAMRHQNISDANAIELTPEGQELRKWLCDTAPRILEGKLDQYLRLEPDSWDVRLRAGWADLNRRIEQVESYRSYERGTD